MHGLIVACFMEAPQKQRIDVDRAQLRGSYRGDTPGEFNEVDAIIVSSGFGHSLHPVVLAGARTGAEVDGSKAIGLTFPAADI